jgi:hypothetical protein
MALFCPKSEVDSNDDSLPRTSTRATNLDAVAQEFLDHLHLPRIHPLCANSPADVHDSSGGGGNDWEEHNDEFQILLSRIGTGSIFELPDDRMSEINFHSAMLRKSVIDERTAAETETYDDKGMEKIVPTLLTSHALQEFHQEQRSPPPIGPISLLELHDNSIPALILTATTMSAPTLAMMELWLRFFAVFFCPLCLCYMIGNDQKM